MVIDDLVLIWVNKVIIAGIIVVGTAVCLLLQEYLRKQRRIKARRN